MDFGSWSKEPLVVMINQVPGEKVHLTHGFVDYKNMCSLETQDTNLKLYGGALSSFLLCCCCWWWWWYFLIAEQIKTSNTSGK